MEKVPPGYHRVRSYVRRNPRPRAKRMSGWTIAGIFGPGRPVGPGLTFNGTIIETGTDSNRLASTRARAEGPAKAG